MQQGIEGGRSALGECALPTGFRIEGEIVQSISYREMAGPEEDILASNMPVATKFTQVMAQCTKAIGQITDPGKIRSLMDQMVVTDRWFYLVKLRCHSLGSDYPFSSKCPSCGHEDKKLFDLNEIKVKNPPKADALFREVKTPSGLLVRMKAADGLTDQRIEKLANDQNAPTVGLFARITEINGQPADLADVKQMSLKDRAMLRKEIEQHEGKLEDTFGAICPKCSHEYEGEIQLDGESFFSL